jgi:hypothetical protein
MDIEVMSVLSDSDVYGTPGRLAVGWVLEIGKLAVDIVVALAVVWEHFLGVVLPVVFIGFAGSCDGQRP